jgi:DNA-directed RNA polymerase subunit beta
VSEEQKLVNFDDEYRTYGLIKFRRTNQDTCINLTPLVRKGEKIVKGQPLCQGYATADGELAHGRNLLVAYMPW